MTGPRGRLAHVVTHYPTYSQSFVRNEIEQLRRLGVDVSVISINLVESDGDEDPTLAEKTWCLKATPPVRILRTILRTAVAHPLAVAKLLRCALAAGWSDLRQMFRLAAQAGEALLVWDRGNTDGVRALHAHFGAPSNVAWLAAEFGRSIGQRWTFTMTIHGPHDHEPPDVSTLAARIRAADGVVCISDYTRSQVQRMVEPQDWSKLCVVRCGVEVDRLGAIGRRARSERATGARRRRLVVPARLAPEKGHLTLVDALALLATDGLELDVRLVGDGPMRAAIADRCRDLGVASSVTFLGALPHHSTLQEMASADVVCLPSYAEGLPVGMMEAMAIGTPVVATSVAGVPELAIDGVTARVVPPADPQRLAGALRDAAGGTPAEVLDRAAEETAQRHDLGENTKQLAQLLAGWHGWCGEPPAGECVSSSPRSGDGG